VWLTLFLLGAYHGINPGMGWLFAVALGLQEKNRRAVWRALPPIALGHFISIGLVVLALDLAQGLLPHLALRALSAAILFAVGAYRLVRSRHPGWVGMRVGFRDLSLWSFLMATAHGAGLMLVPILLRWPVGQSIHSHHAMTLFSSTGSRRLPPAPSWLLPVGVHSLGYLTLTGVLALLVYEKLGVAILRRAWFNLDLVWSVALVATGILTLLV